MRNPRQPRIPIVPRIRTPLNPDLKIGIPDNIVGPNIENSFVQAGVGVVPSRVLDSVSISDEAAKNIIMHNKEGLTSEIVDWFAQQHKVDRESLKIKKLESEKGINADYHYIITHDEKEYHIKPALHGVGLSLGSKFNEIAFYKLNENLKIGPKCDAFVSHIGILMICTEDLKFRSVGNAQDKTISFQDNELEKAKIDKIPERDRDSVHRCVSEIAINLLFYADVQHNYSNTGFKITTKTIDGGLEQRKEKPFIIDFRLSNETDLSDKYPGSDIIIQSEKIREYAQIIASHLNSDPEKKEIPIDIFKFNQEDPQIIKDALKKLFLTENGDITKFDEAISNAFEYSILLAKNSGMSDRDLSHNITNIETQKQKKTTLHVKAFLENPIIKNFLEEEGRKIKAEKALTVSSASGSEGASASTSPRDLESVINISDTKEGVSKSIAV
jgi:hypothetical protein